MSMQAAFEPIHEINRQIVFTNTWGHLAPEPGRKYTGWIVVAKGAYGGGQIVVDCEFVGLPDSPWFYDDLEEFAFQSIPDQVGVYRFDGWYKKFKNGNCQWGGGSFHSVDIGLPESK